MYKKFYGLQEIPFSIAPNPDYLFLSDRHREALAHLTYGLGETGGFVLLTGEVGTGKTTVSRCVIAQLPENSDTAFILNPSLTELELLATLCDELNICYPKNPSLKQLTDLISNRLLENHANGKNTLMIIDEAQHLRPEVLEQLRLLTNLETNTKKLLQIILIGQPELQVLLQRQELRQLAQRITARYHLLPLTRDEVALYVKHRLYIAGRNETLFDKSAITALHKYSEGIPRIINLLCERALMAGYAKSKLTIDKKIITLASTEVLGAKTLSETKWWLISVIIIFAVFSITLLILLLNKPNLTTKMDQPEELPIVTQTQQPLVQDQSPTPINENDKVTKENIHEAIDSYKVLNTAIATSRDLDVAFAPLFKLWDIDRYQNTSACDAAKVQGLACYQQLGTLNKVFSLNFPAVLYMEDKDQTLFYVTLLSGYDNDFLIQLGEQQFHVDKNWLLSNFSGNFELLWQPEDIGVKSITKTTDLKFIQWLENKLAVLQKRPSRLLNEFDLELQQSLKQFQKKNGLDPDGIAGSKTLQQLILYTTINGPRLHKN